MSMKNTEQQRGSVHRFEQRSVPDRREFSQFVSQMFDEKGSRRLDSVIHELRVQIAGLEVQGADLRAANAALKRANDHYFKLYEFAPVGYVSLNNEGVITGLNLTCASMFGVTREKIIHHLFSHFVMLEDTVSWQIYLARIKEFKNEDSVELCLRTAFDSGLNVLINSVYSQEGGLIPSFHLAITDISKIKLAEPPSTNEIATTSPSNDSPAQDESPNRKIRAIRLMKGWSQEEMAEKINMSLNGYGCIERGETDMSLSRLGQIATVFSLSVCELLEFDEANACTQSTKKTSNYQCGHVHHYADLNEQHKKCTAALLELERQKVIVEQKEAENAYLKEMLGMALASKNKK